MPLSEDVFGSEVIAGDLSGRLWMAHFFKSDMYGDGMFAAQESSASFCSGSRADDIMYGFRWGQECY